MNKKEMYDLIENRSINSSERTTLINSIINKIIDLSKDKEVYVLGHNNPDADSIISSYILSNILKSMGINAHFSILDKDYDYTFHDKKLLEENFKYKPLVVSKDNKYFILVDHNDLQGLSKEYVLGAFDHHIIKDEIDNILEIEYASTSLLIYDLFKDKYNFSDEEKYLIGLATLSDTDYLTSTRFTKYDKEVFDTLNLDINVKELQRKYFVTTDFSLGVDKNFEINKKEYIRNNKKITRVQISSYDDNYLEEYINEARKLNYLLLWVNYDNNTTTIYYENRVIKLDYLLSSTYMVFKILEDDLHIDEISIEEFEEKIYDRYTKIFPKEEQRNWKKVHITYDKGLTHFYKIVVNNSIIGFVMLESVEGLPSYVDYFAIYDEYQSMGYGSKAFMYLKDNVCKLGIIGEIEKIDINNINTSRRVEFYKKLGFTIYDGEYILFKVKYTPIALTNKKYTKEEIDKIFYTYYVGNMGLDVFNKNCKLL